MKTFEEYQDGDWVTFINPRHQYHKMQFQLYKSKYTHNAFRLKYGNREVVADISEIIPVSETNNYLREDTDEVSNNYLPRGSNKGLSEEEFHLQIPDDFDIQD